MLQYKPYVMMSGKYYTLLVNFCLGFTSTLNCVGKIAFNINNMRRTLISDVQNLFKKIIK